MLTGRNAHPVGMGCIPEGAVGFPRYNTSLPRSAATVFEILRQNGYDEEWHAAEAAPGVLVALGAGGLVLQW